MNLPKIATIQPKIATILSKIGINTAKIGVNMGRFGGNVGRMGASMGTMTTAVRVRAATMPLAVPQTRLSHGLGLVITVLLGAWVQDASAQWTVVNLHPAGTTSSEAFAVDGGQQVGYARIGGAVDHAALWTGSSESWVDLTPPSATQARALDVRSGRQVGQAHGTSYLAVKWTGTANSWVNVFPGGQGFVEGTDANGEQLVGRGIAQNGYEHATLWSSPTGTWTSLNPPDSLYSAATAVDDGQQVGVVTLQSNTIARASLWTGSAASWVDLHPPFASSSVAYAVRRGVQAGYSGIDGQNHAGTWRGTAASWIDIHPSGADASMAFAIDGLQQAGYATVNGIDRASLWSGTSASWVDLHAVLPPQFTTSVAYGVWVDSGLTVHVVGSAYNGVASRREAIMWSGPPPCDFVSFAEQPTNVALLPAGTAQFQVNMNGMPETFRWRRNGIDLSDGPRVSGATTATLTISSVQASDEGSYDCVVTSACNAVTSNPAVLSCDPILLTHPPAQQLLVPGLALAVTVPANAPYSYRWRQNGQNLFNIPGVFGGVTTRTLTILSNDPSLEGVYDVVVTNACGSATSTAADVRLCFADVNCDFALDGFDVETMERAVGGDMTDYCQSNPDFNGDFALDGFDVEAVELVVGGGPCP